MLKAFDTSDLAEKVKAAGLPMLEEDAKIITKVVFAWLQESVILEGASQPLYLIAVPVLEQLKTVVLSFEDKISQDAPPAATV